MSEESIESVSSRSSAEDIFDALCYESPLASPSEANHFDDQRTFTEELNRHKFNIIYGFNYGEEVAKKTEENIQAYQRKFLKKHFTVVDNKSPEASVIEVNGQATTSKHISDHTTPSEKYPLNKDRRVRKGDNARDTWKSPKSRETPLPLLTWANSKEVWQTMVYKEEATSRTRNCRLFEDPRSFLPRMRAILLDWIMEVCEVYHFRRVTYYLAVDYIDRYLTIKPTIPKNQLQLVGISSLFIAAKLEEIYPPKLSEFSYVCDGACCNEDILECELLLLNTLGWEVNPMTPTGWLNLYMQIHFDAKLITEQEMHNQMNCNFIFPQYSAYQFVRGSQLMDLFSLDPGFLLFNYSIIAAGAMYFLFGRAVALRVSGLNWSDLKDCAEYMAVFYSVIRDSDDPKLQSSVIYETEEKLPSSYMSINYKVKQNCLDENYSLQTHVVDLKYFESSTIQRLQRMGLSVRKTFEKRKKILAMKEEELKKNEDAEEIKKESDEATVVMFEIEKLPSILGCELDLNVDEMLMTDHEIDYFTTKSKFTFDEILIGINDCTSRSLLPNRLINEVQLEKK